MAGQVAAMEGRIRTPVERQIPLSRGHRDDRAVNAVTVILNPTQQGLDLRLGQRGVNQQKIELCLWCEPFAYHHRVYRGLYFDQPKTIYSRAT